MYSLFSAVCLMCCSRKIKIFLIWIESQKLVPVKYNQFQYFNHFTYSNLSQGRSISRDINGIISHLCLHRHSLVGNFKKKILLKDQGVMAPPVMSFFRCEFAVVLNTGLSFIYFQKIALCGQEVISHVDSLILHLTLFYLCSGKNL